MVRFLLGLGMSLLFIPAFGQEKCAFVPYQKHLSEISTQSESPQAFEKWMQLKQKVLQQQKVQQQQNSSRSLSTTATTANTAKYVIPVVVHVIHKGETIGQGSNIPREQILSQLKTLNEDFRALNVADIDKLPASFKPLVADLEIEFVLARQDPEGLHTDGIVRVASAEPSWVQAKDLSLKQLSHWPSDKYLNLYAAVLTSPTIGWAQFPYSDQLPGLSNSNVAEETDGVVVDYRYFGTGYQANSSSKGRTATHEIGHYLGLRHIWADNSDCVEDDFVDDTPLVAKANEACPLDDGPKPESCDPAFPAMYQNYMDYSPDRCMALFTLGQKQRMHVVLQNSPRRKDLHNSIAKQEPLLVANDAGLRDLNLSQLNSCSDTYLPSLVIRNYGNTQLTAVKINLSVNGQLKQIKSLSTNLGYLETQNVQLDALALVGGENQVVATITQTNGARDGKAVNNESAVTTVLPFKRTLPLSQNFETGLSPFQVINPDLSYSWELATAPNGISANNKAAFLNFYDYESIREKDLLASPLLDLRNERSVYLGMRLAFAPYEASSTDGFEVWVTQDCQTNLANATMIFKGSVQELATTAVMSRAFVPKDGSEWVNHTLDLSAYAGKENIRVLFVGVNGWGNNLYLDDIQISSTLTPPPNVALTSINQPTPLFGTTTTPFAIGLKNLGVSTIEHLKLKVIMDDKPPKEIKLEGLALKPGEEKQVSLNPLTNLGTGVHVLQIEVSAPNGMYDGYFADNTLAKKFVLNQSLSTFPIRESFEPDTFDKLLWTSVNPNPGQSSWVSTGVVGPWGGAAEKNYAAAAQYSETSTAADERWLGSTILDISNTKEAGMHFWYYAGGQGEVGLKLIASLDGGLSWPITLWEQSNNGLKGGNPAAALEPGASSSWQNEYLNLKSLIGHKKVRIAFVASGRGLTSLYVDEIEFFQSDTLPGMPLPERNQVALYPNPNKGQFHLSFNMENPKGEHVEVEILNSQGVRLSYTAFPNTLNQIYTFDLPGLPAGIYYLRIRSASLTTSRKVVVTR